MFSQIDFALYQTRFVFGLCNKNVENVWDRNKTLKLMELFKSRPILFVKRIRKKEQRPTAKAIGKIVKSLEISVVEVNRKLHNLRCQLKFWDKKNKKKKSGNGVDDPKSAWEYFDTLNFMTGTLGNLKLRIRDLDRINFWKETVSYF